MAEQRTLPWEYQTEIDKALQQQQLAQVPSVAADKASGPDGLWAVCS